MNYTGFGSDPNYIYSFRPAGGTIGGVPTSQQSIGAREGVTQSLRNSLAYKQAGMEGKQRMEKAVSMGFPANTDISNVRQVGVDPNFFSPIYAAPRPQPWGTWGAVGGEERPVSTPNARRVSQKGESPKEEVPEGYLKSRYGYLQKDYSKEGYTKNRYGYWQKTGNKKSESIKNETGLSGTPFADRTEYPVLGGGVRRGGSPPTLAGSLTGFGGIPRFPYANY